MSYKHKIKSKLPRGLIPLARGIYRLSSIPKYWIPYNLYNGRAANPTTLHFEITYKCNQSCLMCPQSFEKQKEFSKLRQVVKRSEELSFEEIKNLVEESCQLGVRYFTLTGGEPFLRKDLLKVTGFIKEKGMVASILTNGSLLTREGAETLVKQKVDAVQFSLDGPKEIHNLIRNTKNAYDGLIHGINFCIEEKKRAKSITPYLSVSCTISSLNAGKLTEIFDIALRYNIDINFGYLFYTTQDMREKTKSLFPLGEAKIEDQDIPESLKSVDIDLLVEEVKEIKERIKNVPIKVRFSPPLKLKDIEKRFNDDNFVYADKCFYPWYALRINPYGEVYPCSMGVKMGNIMEESLLNIWNGEEYIRFRKALRKEKIFPKCSKCCKLDKKLWSWLPKIPFK